MDDYDYCYECGGYGDDYHLDENGEWVSSCPGCPHNTLEGDYDDEWRERHLCNLFTLHWWW